VRGDRGEAMRQARHLQGQRQRTLVLSAVEAAVRQGEALTIAAVARTAGVGRKFIYDHPDLRAEIELKAAHATHRQANHMIATARVTGASLHADLENCRSQNGRLQQQLRALENRRSQLEDARLVADDILPNDVRMQLADRQLAPRVAELEQQLFGAQEALRQTTEELDAARAVNRHLMVRANRTDAARPPTGLPPGVVTAEPEHRTHATPT
jgi:chromosome segregation ATPase